MKKRISLQKGRWQAAEIPRLGKEKRCLNVGKRRSEFEEYLKLSKKTELEYSGIEADDDM